MVRSICLAFFLLASPHVLCADELDQIRQQAEGLPDLRSLLISRDGQRVFQQGFHGGDIHRSTNIKSASKTLLAALAGMAIDRGILANENQPLRTWLAEDFPENHDPRLDTITISHLLSMQAGLRPTSGPNYGRWVASKHWVQAALAQPFVDDPGGAMQYSTGTSHLLSAILTQATGRSTLELARDWFSPVKDFAITDWLQDPQGIYLGGNQMAMSPLSLLAFGELYLRDGRSATGEQLVSKHWIEQSWMPRTQSRYTGDAYGYGWFIKTIASERAYYAWGYGGQMLYVIPSQNLAVVMTSDSNFRSRQKSRQHRYQLQLLLTDIIELVLR